MIGDRYGREGYQNHNWIYLPFSVVLLILSICNPTLLIFAIPAYIGSLIVSQTQLFKVVTNALNLCQLKVC